MCILLLVLHVCGLNQPAGSVRVVSVGLCPVSGPAPAVPSKPTGRDPGQPARAGPTRSWAGA